MNVCVYELGSMSGARNISRESATTATINFSFTKKRFEFLNAIYNVCVCVSVSESGRAVVASSGGDLGSVTDTRRLSS